MIMKFKKYFILLAVFSLFISCFEDLDDKIYPASTLDIQNFIYRGLNYFYLYKADTPELANHAFESSSERDAFLKSFDSPETLFSYLLSPQDRFSVLFSDYREIENALSGVSLSNGMEFGLVYYPDNSGKVFGYVRYVLPNSSAASKNLERGDLFTTVNGTQLTSQNYSRLLAADSYTIGLASFDGTDFELTGEEIELTKTEYDENPVFLNRTFDYNGQKIGYLVYNSFIKRYDTELNTVFSQFKSEGVTDLILDLRYNGGGSVETATDLGSMITGQFNGEIFYKQIWNEDRQSEYGREGRFDNTISNGNSIHSLNLNRVYILTTKNTASASELVINGLNPYINTVQIGDTTTGKFQASILLYDGPAPFFSRQEASISHRYAMLPLVYKAANKDNHTDFVNGLPPDVSFKENFFNLGELGDPNEPLLSIALAEILGLPKPVSSEQMLQEFSSSRTKSPLHEIMVIEPEDIYN